MDSPFGTACYGLDGRGSIHDGGGKILFSFLHFTDRVSLGYSLCNVKLTPSSGEIPQLSLISSW
jgi:hypothetical protein